ncbi:hypothetical protein MKUB_12170 [Mycobacterium kubicae]|uniref:Uncharacterized protein n=1 Tax=Mycobacterium kubicae TaxID=120959 RepID=A0AAX1JDK5_9MYCO|nr:hypothetical protein [Mycobacterium kubicae]MCV7097874.1 hypothetical protein [Mycobacterium kubicae]OBF23043.1 hypothetical protein A5725_09985 [Mycobacterium kubicae]OBK44739.1 hypothetical protein A5657_03965 [Mycobacterium kubicae]ORW06023.1 hypothetical protein AWC13_23980 [Mycobacterium kubicae]QNI05271.1 hypothetical protein GAN17_02400 [Mycobacterium kubicae]
MKIRYDRWVLPLTVPLGLGPKSSTLRISGPDLHVKMGWAFEATIPLTAIASAQHSSRRVFSRGVHGTSGRGWLVNGSAHGLVDLVLDPPVPARAVGMAINLSRLTISVDDPDALVAACARAN